MISIHEDFENTSIWEIMGNEKCFPLSLDVEITISPFSSNLDSFTLGGKCYNYEIVISIEDFETLNKPFSTDGDVEIMIQ